MMREVQAGAGRAAQDSPCLEFGLAGHAAADTVRVIWPDGSERILTQVAADRALTLVQGDELAGAGDPPPAIAALRLEALPNPFNPRTVLRFILARPARAELALFDVAGRRVRTLLAGAPLPAGPHELVWDGADDAGRSVASGVYLGRLRAGGAAATTRLLLLR